MRLLIFVALILAVIPTVQAGPINWTETFDTGVGRFSLANGLGDSVFVHDAVDGDLNATFIRRDFSAFDADRRLAELGSVFTELDVVGFSVEWTPLGGAPTAFPHIGFFDSTTMADIAVLAVTDNRYQLEIGRGQPDLFHVEDTGFNYALNETYLIELLLDGPSGTVSVSSSILQGGGFVSQGTNSWNFGTSYAFDTLGVGNLLDDQGFGLTFSAEFDNFSFVPEPSTAMLLIVGIGALARTRR